MFGKRATKEKEAPPIAKCVAQLAVYLRGPKNPDEKKEYQQMKDLMDQEVICSSCSKEFVLEKATKVLESDTERDFVFTCPHCADETILKIKW